jgi:hypothetical protein
MNYKIGLKKLQHKIKILSNKNKILTLNKRNFSIKIKLCVRKIDKVNKKYYFSQEYLNSKN